MVAVPKPPPKIIGDLSRGGLTAFLGDSITNDTNPGWMGQQEYHTWAVNLSGGAIQWAGKFGQSGMGFLNPGNSGLTLAQATASILALSPRPSKVVILLGTNDIGAGSKTVAQVIPAYISLINLFRGVGIDPALCTLMPRNDLTGVGTGTINARVHTLNQWISRYARLHGLTLIDFYSNLVNFTTGGYQTGDNRDTLHPAAQGAKKMGQLVATALTSARTWTPYLACDAGDATGAIDPLMLTDTLVSPGSNQAAGDGIPDGWGTSGSLTGVTITMPSAGADAKGNWLKIVRSGATGGLTMRLSPRVAASVGDVIACGFRTKILCATGLMQTNIALAQYASNTFPEASLGNLWVPVSITSGTQADIGPSTYWFEAPVTAATTGYVGMDIFTSAADGELDFGQFTLRNLTALGIA